MAITPMMQQYLDIKEQYKDCILFFRLGDFYEMFFEDALTASRELEITLTGRDCGLEQRAPMCGVPVHAVENYISRLISKGYKVAICEQVEDAALAKGLVKRDVVRVLTPGTLVESTMLDEKKNNYLMALYRSDGIGMATVDVSTGELFITAIQTGNIQTKLFEEISRFSPSEVLVNPALYADVQFLETAQKRLNLYITVLDEAQFDIETATRRLQDQFKIFNFAGEASLRIQSLGGLLGYLKRTSKVDLSHIQAINPYEVEAYMNLDMSTRRNLEMTETLREKNKKGSLLGVLDKTQTSMGGRTLRKWLEQPLTNLVDIHERLDAVEEYKEKFMIRQEIRESLKRVYDMERLIGKVVMGTANGRDLIALKYSILQLPEIKQVMSVCEARKNRQIHEKFDLLTDIYALIEASIVEEAPVSVKEGGLIKSGYHPDLDKLREATTQGKQWILEVENREKEKSGIKNLKVGFNKVFGYYLEVTKSYFHLIPDHFIRKQTLANCERFVTEELKRIEETILGAEEKMLLLEYEIFLSIREKILLHVDRIKHTAGLLAVLDVFSSLAEVADRENYCKPKVDAGPEIKILGGRHPVVESMLQHTNFVPNDTFLNLSNHRIAIITGPNMAGKSTFMRQTAIIVLMAQIGSFVPADEACIGVVDRIFTRVGASDDLAAGQSTFMVEMSEVANILANASRRSLIILDEIGRGTSTYDGLSLAWSVIEYIAQKDKIGARTLFATHYHELTELEAKMSGIQNYCIAVKEKGDDIVFLHKIIRGGADGSYGIQVAKLAGLPQSVIDRAKELLKELENADIVRVEKKLKKNLRSIEGQIDLFALNQPRSEQQKILEKISATDLSKLTPLDALNFLYELQEQVKQS